MYIYMGLPGGSDTVKNLPTVRETWIQSLGGEIPWRKKWLPNPVFLPGGFHGQRLQSMGSEDSDTSEQLTLCVLCFVYHIYVW